MRTAIARLASSSSGFDAVVRSVVPKAPAEETDEV
jgi:mevalonate pyrophosphate decarboxylase